MKRGESETLYQKRLWEIAEETVPQKECGIYTQALMDLGSMVCRRSPAGLRQLPAAGWLQRICLR